MKRKHDDRLKGIRILFEDPFLLVIEKPAGMLTTHTKVVGRAAREAQLTAANVLTDYVRKGQWKSRKQVYLVHRLDRETSGVMMFAKEEGLAEQLREHWNETTEKTYLARVEGAMETVEGVFESYLKENDDGYRVRSVPAGTPGGKLSRTAWRLARSLPLAPFDAGSRFDTGSRFNAGCRFDAGSRAADVRGHLVEVKLHSGRKNQIRVHFSEAGHPVVGDEKYGAAKAPRLYLHAWKLKFRHPRSGKSLEFTSPCPF